MVKGNFLKKVLMVSVAGVLVVTPLAVSANVQTYATGSNHDKHNISGNDTSSTEDSGSSGSSGSKSSSSSSTPAAPSTVEFKAADGTVIKSTVPGSYTAKKLVAVPAAPAAAINSAFGVKAGQTAFIRIADSNYGPAAKASLDAAVKAVNAELGPVIDIAAGVMDKNGKLNSVGKAGALVEFQVKIPAGFAKAGYEVAMINIQPGGTVAFCPNWSTDPGTMKMYTDTFGVFAFVNVPAGSMDTVKTAQYKQANGIQ